MSQNYSGNIATGIVPRVREVGPDGGFAEGRNRLKTTLKGGGIWYTTLYVTRMVIDRLRRFLDNRLVAIEQRKSLVEPWTISARRHTVMDNKQLWNTHDWSRLGEEWTQDEEWKGKIINQFLIPNVPENSTVVEIGPGGGRWTEVLERRAAKLYVVDVSEKAIDLCRQRFANSTKIEYREGNGSTISVPDASIDVVWSYDVFVHINPLDTRGYFCEFRRVLKPGGRAVIHHPGPPLPGGRMRLGWRSDVTDKMILNFAEENGLRVIQQHAELVNEGDLLSVLERPA